MKKKMSVPSAWIIFMIPLHFKNAVTSSVGCALKKLSSIARLVLPVERLMECIQETCLRVQ
jgi:hypothetical protein